MILRMAFGDVLMCIPYCNEGKNYCDIKQVCQYFDVRRGFEGFSDVYEQVFEEKPSKSWSLKGFVSSFWLLGSTGSC